MVYWELPGKPHLVQPQCDLRVSGNKVWVGDGILELPGQQNWKPCGMAGKGGLLTGKESRQQQYMTCLCKNYQPDAMLPRIRILEEQAISGPKEAPNDLLRVIIMHLIPASECRKGEWEDDWTEGVCSTCRACFGVWNAKIQSWRLAEDWRCDLEMEQFIRVKLKIEVSMLCKGQDEDILIKLWARENKQLTTTRGIFPRGECQKNCQNCIIFSNFFCENTWT